MYTQIWNKYLPVIRILLKRSISGNQGLSLNVSDFQRAGVGRKSGYKFSIQFVNGRVDNIISTSALAKDLAALLLQDPVISGLFAQNDYHIDMDAKFHLEIKCFPKEVLHAETAVTPEDMDNDEVA